MKISKHTLLFLIFLSSFFSMQIFSRNVTSKKHRLKQKKSKKQRPAQKINTMVQQASTHKNHHVTFEKIEKFINSSLSSSIKKYYSEVDRDDVDGMVDKRVIDGWFDRKLIPLLCIIDDFQTKRGISGNVAEIGVWQGRSFIPMAILTKNKECALAIDCFELYQFNFDNSGGVAHAGPFMKNVKKYWSATERLKMLKGNSLDFTSDDYLDAAGNGMAFRMFSIDGSHEAGPTACDMENAFECLAPGGIIIIDDYFKQTWPGVSEGVNAYMNNNVGSLKPFFIGWNKIFFTQPEYAQHYSDCIRAFLDSSDVRIKKFFDVETLVYDGRD